MIGRGSYSFGAAESRFSPIFRSREDELRGCIGGAGLECGWSMAVGWRAACGLAPGAWEIGGLLGASGLGCFRLGWVIDRIR